MHKRFFRFIASAVCLTLLWTVPDRAAAKSSLALSVPALAQQTLAPSDFQRELHPERIHSRACKQIIKLLAKRHYRELAVDDQLSLRLFERFLSDLDPNHIYFLAADVRELDRFQTRLDDSLKSGDVNPAYIIFNRYQHRIVESLIYLVNRIEQHRSEIRLDVVETLDTDREKAPWPKDADEQQNLWRKRLKNEVLKRKLKGKPIAEIAQELSKKYRNQLNRIQQTNSEDVFRLYMNALTRGYDPHTQYFSPRMSENFKIQMSLSLEGIGAVLQIEGEYTEVVRLVPAGPADKGKALMPGDRIVSVGQGMDGELVDVVGWRLDDVVQLIRGPKGTTVRLEILPAGMDDHYQTHVVSIERNTVKLEEQAAQKEILEITHDGRPFKLGVIEVPTFYLDFNAYHAGQKDYKSTSRDVQRLLQELTAAGVQGVIMDLRDNGGGALQEATDLTGLFIEEGPTVQVREAGGNLTTLRDTDPDVAYSGPLAVLVNRMSASAAEIFAGAIQDYHRGIIIGSQTFGKGTVQSLVDLTHGQLKLTFATFYRVTGESTQHKGVLPDIAYPSIYDTEKIGESALPEALPWSQIASTEFAPYPERGIQIRTMRNLHENRSLQSPDFAYLVASIKNLKEIQGLTHLPLDEPNRRSMIDGQKRRRLAVENTRRVAKGLAPLKQLEEEEEEEAEPLAPLRNADSSGAEDPLLLESGRILADFISLSGANR